MADSVANHDIVLSRSVRQQNTHAAQMASPPNGHAWLLFFTVVKLSEIASDSRYVPGAPHDAHGDPSPLASIATPVASHGTGELAPRQMSCVAFTRPP